MENQQGSTATAEETQTETGAAGSLSHEGEDSTKGPKTSENKSDKGTGEGGAKGKENGQEKEEEALTIKGITKLEDGTFEFAVNEETVYRGKTIDEVLEKVREGTNVKDSLIRKAKLSEKLNTRGKSRSREDEDDEDHPKVKAPDENEIAERHFKQALATAGITVEQARNVQNEKFWEKYKDENPDVSDYAVMQLRLKIDRVLDKANEDINADVAEQARIYRNDQTSMRLSATVSELLEDAKIPVEQVGEGKAFDYSAILDKCEKDGVLDGERVLIEAQKAIRAIERASNKSATRQKLEEDAEKAKKDREKVAGLGGAGKERQKTIVPAKDYRSATAAFMKEHPAG